MLEDYFNKIDVNETYSPEELGKNISHLPLEELPKEQVKVALIGVGIQTDLIRKELYKLHVGEIKEHEIIDLGNIKESIELYPALKIVTHELIGTSIIPVLIGQELDLIQPIHEGLSMHHVALNISYISSHIPTDKGELLHPLINNTFTRSQLNFIGHQSHYVSSKKLNTLYDTHHGQLRLGKLRTNLEESELFLRNSELAIMDLNAIKVAEAPAKKEINSSGLTSEEACQIARYAGMSDYNKCFGLLGFVARLDDRNKTAQLCAQILWYFFQGAVKRIDDQPNSHIEFIKYRCDFDDTSTPILFLKSKKTDRWWMKIEHPAEPDNADLAIIVPCTYEDYLISANGDTPDRYLNALRLLK